MSYPHDQSSVNQQKNSMFMSRNNSSPNPVDFIHYARQEQELSGNYDEQIKKYSNKPNNRIFEQKPDTVMYSNNYVYDETPRVRPAMPTQYPPQHLDFPESNLRGKPKRTRPFPVHHIIGDGPGPAHNQFNSINTTPIEIKEKMAYNLLNDIKHQCLENENIKKTQKQFSETFAKQSVILNQMQQDRNSENPQHLLGHFDNNIPHTTLSSPDSAKFKHSDTKISQSDSSTKIIQNYLHGNNSSRNESQELLVDNHENNSIDDEIKRLEETRKTVNSLIEKSIMELSNTSGDTIDSRKLHFETFKQKTIQSVHTIEMELQKLKALDEQNFVVNN